MPDISDPKYFLSDEHYAVVHFSNWPAKEAGLAKTVNHLNTIPMLMPHAAFRVIVHVNEILTEDGNILIKAPDENKRPEWGDQWELMIEGQVVHIWLDTTDTFEPKDVLPFGEYTHG
jgi:hypothetical protein